MKLHRKKALPFIVLVLLGLSRAVLADGVLIALQQTESGTFSLNTTLGSAVSSSMLLDTGSAYVSLSQSTFSRLDPADYRYSRSIYGRMANGQVSEVPVYTLSSLVLSQNCRLENIEVAVFAGSDRDILGMNALLHLQPFTLQLGPPLLSGSQCN